MGRVFQVIGVVVVALIGISLLGRVVNGSKHSSSADSGVSANLPACTASSFSVTKIKARTVDDYAHLTGVVTNHCSAAVGVQLKWTAYNSDGTIAFSRDFWPASITNIQPQVDYAFEMMETAPRGKWTYQVDPITVETW